MLCELETDKVSVEVPAPAAGTLSRDPRPRRQHRRGGGKLAVIGGSAGAAPAAAPARPGPGRRASAGPAARMSRTRPRAKKLMAEKGLDRDQVRAPAATGAS
jgi:2-oxoglutarate dehydrogenase E2 component (dihydrolipoamide succinyltransferase)